MRKIIISIYHKLPKPIRRKIVFCYLFIFDREAFYIQWKYRRHNVRYGSNNPNVHFFVIRKNPRAMGLLSCYLTAVAQMLDIDDSISKGDIVPVMDMYTEYYSMLHKDRGEVLRFNAWEHYFLPLSRYSMEDVLSSKKVTLGCGFTEELGRSLFDNTKINKNMLKKFIVVDNKYFHLKDELKSRFENTTSLVIGDKRVLGTMVREAYVVFANSRDKGEDEYKQHPGIEGHPVQPNINKLCEELGTKMNEWHCDYLFAVFETTYTENIFKSYFKEKILYTGRNRVYIENLLVSDYMKGREKLSKVENPVERNTDYLEEVFLLSKCTSLYAAKCSGSIVAAMWNKGEYENMNIIQNGLY